jgi:alkylation response protein AidB-like acyl-CoA dehydrogenase
MTTPLAIETALGDPADPHNPFSFDAVLGADEAAVPLPGSTELLTELNWSAELVPRIHGGQLSTIDRLVQLLRPLFRRDATIGLGAGIAPLLSAALVWSSGDPGHQEPLAKTMLANRLPLASYGEPDSQLAGSELVARRYGDELALDGSRPAVSGLTGWDSPVAVVARTGSALGSTKYSVVLLPHGSQPRAPRQHTGVRGLRFGDLDLGAQRQEPQLVGDFNGGLELARTALAVTRTTLAGAVVGLLDTQLRTALESAQQCNRLPDVRSALVGAFADLLVLDCLATVAGRALHLMPGRPACYLSAVDRLAVVLARDVITALDGVLGMEAHRRDAIFQKHRRDLLAAPLVATGGARRRATLIPGLPGGEIERDSPDPATLFGIDEALPDLDFAGLAAARLSPGDPLSELSAAGLPGALASYGDQLATGVRQVQARSKALPPRDRTPLATPDAFALAGRYTLLVAAASCIGVWRHNQTGFIQDPAWLTAALHRLLRRLGDDPGAQPAEVDERVMAELLARHGDRRAFDLRSG